MNGDRPLGRIGQAQYFLLNWLNNRLPEHRLDPQLAVRDFQCGDFAARAEGLARGASPSRKLSDLFWMTLPWARIEEDLGPIRVFDVGCGSGQYGQRLLSWSGNRMAAYTGADLQPHEGWAALAREDPRLHFLTADAGRLQGAIPPDANVVISQSAIEHMDDDLGFFEQVRAHLQRLDGSALQIHLCPSPACLWLYLLHGVRQYTPRTLSKITRLFDDGYAVVYRLGGRACNRLHFRFITWPLSIRRTGDLRITRAVEYESRVAAAIEDDMTRPQPSPAFYALVIHTRPQHRLF